MSVKITQSSIARKGPIWRKSVVLTQQYHIEVPGFGEQDKMVQTRFWTAIGARRERFYVRPISMDGDR